LLIHRGAVLPVIDLAQIVESHSCSLRLCTRIVVLEMERQGLARRFGLLAERVGVREWVDTPASAQNNGMDAAALGRMVLDDQGVFQLVDPARLVPEERQEVMFPVAAREV
jgi:chemotaxis signal transduction protein